MLYANIDSTAQLSAAVIDAADTPTAGGDVGSGGGGRDEVDLLDEEAVRSLVGAQVFLTHSFRYDVEASQADVDEAHGVGGGNKSGGRGGLFGVGGGGGKGTKGKGGRGGRRKSSAVGNTYEVSRVQFNVTTDCTRTQP